jgi:2-phosphosulfolactate phosphatase
MKVCVSVSTALPLAISKPECVVVIDVLRSAVTAATALNNGAECVRMFPTIEETLAWKAANPHVPSLLCGERGYRRIEGFDLGNSPLEYPAEVVKGRTILLTTTNGPVAFSKLDRDCAVHYACLANITATAKAINEGCCGSLAIVCAGTRELVSMEDVICAGGILASIADVEFADDGCLIAQWAWNRWGGCVREHIAEFEGGKRLAKMGMEADLAPCSEIDCFSFAVRFDRNREGFYAYVRPD